MDGVDSASITTVTAVSLFKSSSKRFEETETLSSVGGGWVDRFALVSYIALP